GTVALSPEGHYRTLADAENALVYIVQTAAGQETLTPEQFATRHGWANLPDSVGPPLPEPEPEPEEETPPEERSILVGEKADEPAG
ncbi:MAG: signal recognition particle-docking protein FtsY, partial [Planctomycetes bacterium]|nr:signal recognition particle-docking protein FtsY [Planctomycetota bacterium]